MLNPCKLIDAFPGLWRLPGRVLFGADPGGREDQAADCRVCGHHHLEEEDCGPVRVGGRRGCHHDRGLCSEGPIGAVVNGGHGGRGGADATATETDVQPVDSHGIARGKGMVTVGF